MLLLGPEISDPTGISKFQYQKLRTKTIKVNYKSEKSFTTNTEANLLNSKSVANGRKTKRLRKFVAIPKYQNYHNFRRVLASF
jgi:hypothetical protein